MRSTVADFFVGITSLPFPPDAVLERRPESRTYPNRYLGTARPCKPAITQIEDSDITTNRNIAHSFLELRSTQDAKSNSPLDGKRSDKLSGSEKFKMLYLKGFLN
jgi:hypothetical protein